MKLNSHVIFLIAIVGIITAGVVGATLLNNGSMKQVDFDGIKVSVPADSNFVKTADGYADSKYGITINTFKNNDSVVNYLKSKSGASVIALKNQPPQSVAFTQGDDTNVLITNGVEAMAIGAKDQNLVSDMANTVVFSNHQKSAKPAPVIPAILPPPHLELHHDFYLIQALLAQVNTQEFNLAAFEANINTTITDYNIAADNNTLSQYTANEFAQNMPSDNGAVGNNQQNTSLLDNQNVSTVVSSIGSDNQANGNSAGGDSGAAASSSGGANAPAQSIAPDANANSNPSSSASSSSGASSSGSSPASSSSSAPSSGSSGSSGDVQKQKITSSDAKNAALSKYPGATVSGVSEKGSYFLVSLKDSSGTHKVKVDAYSGQVIG
jgi:hypothetical protein